MTQLERIAQQEARALDAVAKKKAGLAKVQTIKRALTSKARKKRMAEVGALADEHGLCALDDTTLHGLFRYLSTLTAAPNPMEVLEGLLGDVDGTGIRVPGMADAAASCGTGSAIE